MLSAGTQSDMREHLAAMPDAAPAEVAYKDYKRNVRCIFVILMFAVSSSSVTLGPLFDAFLLNLGKSGKDGHGGNILVGAVESTRGMLQLIFAYPIGALSDRMPRVRLVRRSTPFWTIGFFTVVLGVVSSQLGVIFAGIATFAISQQLWNSTAQVMVADYSPPQDRTKMLSYMASLRLVANSLGPLLQICFLLSVRQNHWSNWLLCRVICGGCLLWPGVIYGVSRLSDLPALDKVAGAGRGGGTLFPEEALERQIWGVKLRWIMAANLELGSFVTSIGAGMTVKFFPLFFRVDYGFTPIQVCLLSFCYPLCISLMMQVCRLIGERLGRLHAALLFHFLGTSALWGLCFSRNLMLVLPLFLLRGALMNARSPIIRAMVMDLVSSGMRGRWNAVQSISSFTWSGSAVLGGLVADMSGDYRFTFNVTAGIYTLSFCLMLPLLLICPKEEQPKQQPPQTPPQAEEAPAPSSSGLVSSPFLLEPSTGVSASTSSAWPEAEEEAAASARAPAAALPGTTTTNHVA